MLFYQIQHPPSLDWHDFAARVRTAQNITHHPAAATDCKEIDGIFFSGRIARFRECTGGKSSDLDGFGATIAIFKRDPVAIMRIRKERSFTKARNANHAA
jgi:hypothetical protein